MKIPKLIWCVLCAAALATLGLVGCEPLELYKVDAPSDLQKQIDSLAAAKAGNDTTFLDIATKVVGPEDNSAAFWTYWSDYFTIPTNKLLHLEFVNHGNGLQPYFNWDVVVTNPIPRGGTGYAEYFVLRADSAGWGNKDFNAKLISIKEDGNRVNWSNFIANMQGAYVTMEIDQSVTGNVFITATSVGTNGVTIVETYQQPVSATEDITSFLVCDKTHFEMKKAYLLPSKVTAVKDVNAARIVVNGAPPFVELGDPNFWGKAKATVTFADSSTTVADSTDLSFNVVPAMNTVGKKTVVVAYSKTKQGKYGPAVSTLYNLEVTNSVSSLTVTTLPNITKFYFFGNEPVIFNTTGLVVTATYSDGSKKIMPHESLQFGKIPAIEGSQSAVISYVGPTKTVTTTLPVTMVKGINQVGANDFSTPWATYSNEYKVASGSSTTITMYCYSNNVNNWNSPSLAVGKAGNLNVDMTQPNAAAAVVRMDHFGWGPGYNPANATSDWDWTKFASNLYGSKVVIKVTNHGNNTADILYDVTYASGEKHFQKYAAVTVTSSDLSCALVTEKAYLVIVE